MSHSKILVTGADGFIGSHLTELLVRQGYDVRAFVYYNSFNSWGWLDHAPADIKAEIDVFAGDVRDPHGVHTAMRDCSAVCHLAALIGIPYSYHSPAHNENVEKVVQTSTSEVYGTAQFVPITEDHPRRGQSPYAATKIGADELALSFFHSFDTPVTVLRPFNTYGPRQSARAVIPTLITQMLAGKRQVKLGATEPTRDFNFVADVARAFVAALTKDAAIGEVINIGSNFEISVGDTARIIAGASGVDVEIVTDAERLRPARSEIERLWADNAKARELLGWTPEYGGLDGFRRGIVETIEWFRDPANLARYKTDLYAI
jgi:dTDP-glucose 4,6-dehydratase